MGDREHVMTLDDIEVGAAYEKLDADGQPTGHIGMCTMAFVGQYGGRKRIDTMHSLHEFLTHDNHARGWRRAHVANLPPPLQVELPKGLDERIDFLEGVIDRVERSLQQDNINLQKRCDRLEERVGELTTAVTGLKQQLGKLRKAVGVKATAEV